jgi:hypothetical protein
MPAPTADELFHDISSVNLRWARAFPLAALIRPNSASLRRGNSGEKIQKLLKT